MRHLVAFVALGSLVIAGASCSSSGTYVVVHVDKSATVTADIVKIDLQLTLGGQSANTTLSEKSGGPLPFPTDAVLAIQSGEGTLTVVAIARDASGAEVARANGSTVVKRDNTVNLSLTFGPSANDMGSGTSLLTLSDITHDYGTLVTGTSASFTFTVTNGGTTDATALTTSLGGADAGSYAIMNDTCSGTTLAASATCTLDVVFQPTATGTKVATLVVSDADGPVSADLTGVAVAPAALAIAPAGGNAFTGIAVGTSSSAFTFTVSNSGAVASGALSVAVTGSNAADFVVGNDTCTGQMLPAGGGTTCTLDITFSPAATGARAATLTVTGSPGGTAVAPLSGTGLQPATLQVHLGVTSHDFMVVQPSMVSSVFTIQFDNVGFSATGVPSGALSGTDAGDFAFTSHCTAAVPASGNCTVDLQFAPMSGGSKTATFTLSATPGGSAALTLTGQAPPIAPASMASCPGDGKMRVIFAASAGATSYNIYVSTTTPVNRATATKIAGVPSGGVNVACTNGTTCYAVATALNAYGESVNSTQVSAGAAALVGNAVYVGAYTSNAVEIFDGYSMLPAATTGGSRVLSGAATGINNLVSVLVDRPFNDLYVVSRANATVRIWHGASTVNGNVAPTRTLTSVTFPESVALDPGKDRLYVSDNGSLKIWKNACALNGAVAPDATITITGVNPNQMFLDDVHDMIYMASNSGVRAIAVLLNASTLTGTVTKAADRIINVMNEPTNPTYFGVSVDQTNDTLFVGINDATVAYGIANASTLSGIVPATTTTANQAPFMHAAANTMFDGTDCANVIRAYSPDAALPASPTKTLTSGLSGPCYESVWYLP